MHHSKGSTDMHYTDPKKMPTPVCNFLPSYRCYEGFNASLATGFLNLVEMIIRLAKGFRR